MEDFYWRESRTVDAILSAAESTMMQVFLSFLIATIVWLTFSWKIEALRWWPFSSNNRSSLSSPPYLSRSHLKKSLSSPWWDDLAPPFSLENVDFLIDEKGLHEYNGQPTDVLHFCFLIHGHRGYSRDLSYLQAIMDIFVEKEKRKLYERCKSDPSLKHHDVVVYCPACNEGKTTDGIVNGGNRVVEEMYDVMRTHIKAKPTVPSEITVSIVGNSLGGVYGRYALMRFAQDGLSVDGKHPFSFNVFCTTATPHLGLYKHTYMPLPRTAEIGVARAMGETGLDLFLVTDLMKRMATTAEYLEPLRQFRKRIALANAFGTDFPVPVGTAAFLSDQSDYPHHFEETGEEGEKDSSHSQRISSSAVTESEEEEAKESDLESNQSKLVIATLHTPQKYEIASNESTMSAEDSKDQLDADLVQMSQALDSLGWKKVFVDVRNEIPMGIKIPKLSSSSESSDSVEELKVLKQKGVVESRKFKQVISASVPLSKEGKLSLPLGHNMIVAFSRSRLATLMNKGGRPVVDALAKELVEDIFSWSSSSDTESEKNPSIR